MCPCVELRVGWFFFVEEISGIFGPDQFVFLHGILDLGDFLPFHCERKAVVKLVKAKRDILIPDLAIADVSILLVV